MWLFNKKPNNSVNTSLEQTYPRICHVTDQRTEFIISATTHKEAWRAETFAQKEVETNEWIQNELKSNSVFWDIGANIGLYSLYAAKLQPSCRILAFEPESQNFASLCKNIFINKIDRLDALNIAVSGGPAEVSDIYVSELEAGSSVHNLNEASPWSSKKPVFIQKVFSASVDELVNNYNLPAPTMLKIDVDGLELQILGGCRSSYVSNIITLLVEVDANNTADVENMTSILHDAGFTLLNKSIRTTEINNMLPRNFIWKKQ